MRIGVLLNHEVPHQVLHAAPIACELSRRYPEFEVVILTSRKKIERLLNRVLALYPDHRCSIRRLRQSYGKKLISRFANPVFHPGKMMRLSENLDFLRNLDALITPEKTSLILKDDSRLQHLKFIHTRHGAGDRAVGFDSRSGAFDLVLAPGQKVYDRLINNGIITPGRCRIVGYPKFDVAPYLAQPQRPFPQDRAVVVYNPHYSLSESSWRKMGDDILDFFCESQDYNLIFAPHALLYNRAVRHLARPLWRERRCGNILVDTGSLACHDMSHLLAADIYLGDVSSQIYEFLYKPRPCIFLDAHNLQNREPAENLRHWQAGEVIDAPDKLEPALRRAQTHPDAARAQQDKLFDETFFTDSERTAGARAADAIADFLCLDTQAASSRADSGADCATG